MSVRWGLAALVMLGWGCAETSEQDDDAPLGGVESGAGGNAPAGGAAPAGGQDDGIDAGVQADAAEDAPDAAPPAAEFDPLVAGPRTVGYRVDSVTYDAPAGFGARTLRLALWYPTDDEGGTPPRYLNVVARPGLIEDAAPAVGDRPPLLVFSHGNQGIAEQTYSMMEHFASHGWVVAAPDHTGNTLQDNTADATRLFEVRPADVSAVIDYLEALPEADGLGGVLGEDIALSGHSFGGYTTLAVSGAGFMVDLLQAGCAQAGQDFCDYIADAADRYRAGFLDERVDVALPLAPAGAQVFGPGVGDIDVPILLVTGLRDQLLRDAVDGTPIWRATSGEDDLRVQFLDAGHFSFTDLCPLAQGQLDDDGCGGDFTPAAEVMRWTRAYALAFARAHVLGDEAAADWLDGARGEGIFELER
jgi:predicted dienelactone hydrolase